MEKRAGSLKKNKQAQVTIFVIIAIMIVVFGILIYMLYPKLKTDLSPDLKNPSGFIQGCIEDEIKNNVAKLSLQGGSLNPENYFLYDGSKVGYLCYTEKYYDVCSVQQPLLKSHVENELIEFITPKVQDCFDSLKTSYEKENYDVNLEPGEIIIKLLPKKILGAFDYRLTLTKGGSEQYYPFRVKVDNNLYELVNFANSIVEYELLLGDCDPMDFMSYYPGFKITKNLRDEGTKVYTIEERETGNKFQFASRSMVFPPGY